MIENSSEDLRKKALELAAVIVDMVEREGVDSIISIHALSIALSSYVVDWKEDQICRFFDQIKYFSLKYKERHADDES